MNLNGQDWGEVRFEHCFPSISLDFVVSWKSSEQLSCIMSCVQVVFKKKKPTGAAAHSEAAVNAALRAGQPVETVKKFAAGTNKAKAAPVKDAAKLDRETEELHHERYCCLLSLLPMCCVSHRM